MTIRALETDDAGARLAQLRELSPKRAALVDEDGDLVVRRRRQCNGQPGDRSLDGRPVEGGANGAAPGKRFRLAGACFSQRCGWDLNPRMTVLQTVA
jgi:hypothetical protein